MAEVEKIIDAKQVVRLDVDAIADRDPAIPVDDAEIRQPALVRERRVAHPYPDHLPAFDEGKRLDFSRGGNLLLTGHGDAAAAAIEHQPVIAALHIVFDELADRQRNVAVTAAILDRNRLSGFGAIQKNRLIEDLPAE